MGIHERTPKPKLLQSSLLSALFQYLHAVKTPGKREAIADYIATCRSNKG